MQVKSVPGVLAGVALCALLAPGPGAEAQAETRRAWMGAEVRDLEPGERAALGLGEDRGGILVDGVDDEGPAARAGLEPGDVVTELDGQSVGDANDFQQRLRERRPGQKVRLTVRRAGKTRRIALELAAQPRDAFEPLEMDLGLSRLHALTGPRLGVWTADLDNTELAAYFGVAAREGVLVTGVVEGSGAARAGVQGGDVILAVGAEAVHDAAELRRALAEHDEDEEVELRVRRRNRAERLRVRLESAPLALGLPRTTWSWRSGELDDLKRELGDLRRELEKLQREMHGGKE